MFSVNLCELSHLEPGPEAAWQNGSSCITAQGHWPAKVPHPQLQRRRHNSKPGAGLLHHTQTTSKATSTKKSNYCNKTCCKILRQKFTHLLLVQLLAELTFHSMAPDPLHCETWGVTAVPVVMTRIARCRNREVGSTSDSGGLQLDSWAPRTYNLQSPHAFFDTRVASQRPGVFDKWTLGKQVATFATLYICLSFE